MKKFIEYSNKLVDGTRSINVAINVPGWITALVITAVVVWLLIKQEDINDY